MLDGAFDRGFVFPCPKSFNELQKVSHTQFQTAWFIGERNSQLPTTTVTSILSFLPNFIIDPPTCVAHATKLATATGVNKRRSVYITQSAVALKTAMPAVEHLHRQRGSVSLPNAC